MQHQTMGLSEYLQASFPASSIGRKMFFGRFRFLPFLAGLILGGIVFLVFKPESKDRVVKWPHPENAGKVTYRDRNGLC